MKTDERGPPLFQKVSLDGLPPKIPIKFYGSGIRQNSDLHRPSSEVLRHPLLRNFAEDQRIS